MFSTLQYSSMAKRTFFTLNLNMLLLLGETTCLVVQTIVPVSREILYIDMRSLLFPVPLLCLLHLHHLKNQILNDVQSSLHCRRGASQDAMLGFISFVLYVSLNYVLYLKKSDELYSSSLVF